MRASFLSELRETSIDLGCHLDVGFRRFGLFLLFLVLLLFFLLLVFIVRR